MASEQAVDCFSRLATELISSIVEVPALTARDLAAFAATCQRHYDVAITAVYRKNVEEEHEDAGKKHGEMVHLGRKSRR